MLVYRKKDIGGNPPGMPRECGGASTVSHWSDATHTYVGTGGYPGIRPTVERWAEGADGWEVGVALSTFDPLALTRNGDWVTGFVVEDGYANKWFVPKVLNQDGSRGFKARVGGKDFQPMFTPDQDRAMAICRAHLAGDDFNRGEAAAWLLAQVHYLSVETIASLGLMDEALIDNVLNAAAGR